MKQENYYQPKLIEGINMNTLDELKQKRDEILSKNAYWKKLPIQDGSYEASLSHDGYYKITKQIKELETVKELRFLDEALNSVMTVFPNASKEESVFLAIAAARTLKKESAQK